MNEQNEIVVHYRRGKLPEMTTRVDHCHPVEHAHASGVSRETKDILAPGDTSALLAGQTHTATRMVVQLRGRTTSELVNEINDLVIQQLTACGGSEALQVTHIAVDQRTWRRLASAYSAAKRGLLGREMLMHGNPQIACLHVAQSEQRVCVLYKPTAYKPNVVEPLVAQLNWTS